MQKKSGCTQKLDAHNNCFWVHIKTRCTQRLNPQPNWIHTQFGSDRKKMKKTGYKVLDAKNWIKKTKNHTDINVHKNWIYPKTAYSKHWMQKKLTAKIDAKAI